MEIRQLLKNADTHLSFPDLNFPIESENIDKTESNVLIEPAEDSEMSSDDKNKDNNHPNN